MIPNVNDKTTGEYGFNPQWFLHLPGATLPLDGSELVWGWQNGKLVQFTLENVIQIDAVTSVGLALPASLFSVSGSPVTTTGTLTGTLINQNQGSVFAGPSSGGAGLPSFRPLVSADLPTVQPAQGGTGQTTLTAHAVLLGEGTSGVGFAAPATGGTLLASNGAASDPSFQTLTALGIAHSGANNDITSLSGLSTPLSVAQGGTGTNTLTAHAVLVGEGTSTPALVSPGTAGNLLASNGASADPSFQTLAALGIAPLPLPTNSVGTTQIAAGSIFDAQVNSAAAINATKLSYTAANGGSARAVNGRLDDFPDFRCLGVAGNGSTDDSAAILAAINGGSGEIWLPSGTYKLGSTVQFNRNNVKIMGAGEGATILSCAFAAGDILCVGDGTANPNNVTIAGLSITSTVTKTSGAAIHFRNGHRLSARDIRIDNNMNWGFQFDGGSGQFGYFLNNFEINSGSVGILVGQDGTLCQDLYVNTGIISTPTSGIYLVNLSGGQFRDIDLISCNFGVTTQGLTSGFVVTAVVFHNVQCDTCTSHGWNLVSNGGGLTDVRLVDCWGSSNGSAATDNGIYINAFSGVINGINLVAPHCINNKGSGIYVGASQNVNISAPQCFQNSTFSSGTKSGIEIAAGVTEFSIVGGQCRDGGKLNGASHQAFGVLVNSGSSNNYIITGVNCNGNVTTGVSDGGTGANKVVTNNLN